MNIVRITSESTHGFSQDSVYQYEGGLIRNHSGKWKPVPDNLYFEPIEGFEEYHKIVTLPLQERVALLESRLEALEEQLRERGKRNA